MKPQMMNVCLFWEAISSDQFEGLHLAKVCRVAQHVYEHKFGHIPVPV